MESLESRALLAADFGDAPTPYPVPAGENGAQHTTGGALKLGATVDSEADGTHSANADADGADEDGVTFGTIMVGALNAIVTVNVTGAAGKLDAWIDFNGDGSWGGPGERILASQNVVVGNNNLTFDVPSDAIAGTTYARFRLSTAGALGPRGAATDGEVEDYQVIIDNPSASSAVFGGQNTISTTAIDPYSVVAADVDGDGDMDVLSASGDDKIAWYENNGTPAIGSWTAHTISTTANGAETVFAADVDGDGDIDVLSASFQDDKIAWYENDGTPANGGWTAHTISTAVDSAWCVSVADVDGDGDLDVLSAAIIGDRIHWYENDGTPAVGGWTARTISTAVDGAAWVTAADVDGDGDMDVLSASAVADKIAWHENDGTPTDGGWIDHTISTAADATHNVFAADVDGDGDMDVLSASRGSDKIEWYENDGTPGDGGWTTHTISTSADNARSVFAADLDGDGDLDVLSASFSDDKIAWYENDGTPAAGSWTARTISTAADGAYSVFAADVDGDGDLDVLSASYRDDKIAWYENLDSDYGDAPTPYPTTNAENGARHKAVGPTLGATRDLEADGAHSADASADGADEDGVTSAGPLVVGQTTNITINVSAPGFVNAWSDLNRDGDWDDLGEQFLTNFAVVAGDNVIPFSIPSNFTPGPTVSRYRITSASVTSPAPTGLLPDGEVEDYVATIYSADFGDAPTGYPVTLAANGARHLATGPTLGSTRDSEADGTNSANADADGADEDGVTAAGPLVVGQTTNITINASGPGFVNAWSDLNRDGDWDDLGEQFLTNFAVVAGDNTIPFSIPANFTPGPTITRYRLTSASVASPAPTGLLPDGEVEDYKATIYSAPQITTNTLTISEGAAVVLSAANINTTDPDNTPAEWTYTASGVTHGQFELVASPGVAVTSFTQAQINAGAVRFVHAGDVQPPTYSLTVSDGSFTSGTSAAAISFSFEGWVFEAESDFGHQLGSAEGDGWKANPPNDAAGYLTFGPYTTVIDSGVYSAAFRLKISSPVAPEISVARIDVWDHHAGRQLAVKVLRGGDFAAVGVYQDFTLQFQVDNDDAVLEFRTYWFGTVGLEEDRVRVRYAMTDYESETDFGHLTGSAASGGWQATVGTDAPGYLAYGPYASGLEPGHYTANFRLQIGAAVGADTIVASIDVWDFHANKSLAKKVLYGGDFAAVGVDQDFSLQFEAEADSILEYRTFWHGLADVSQDRVRVVPIPIIDFEAESELAHQVGAASGDGWQATVATDPQGYLAFGPYATDINAGAYSATFRLQVGAAVDAAVPVATIDVWNHQIGRRLASKLLYARDFAAVGVYQDFVLPFNLTDDDSVLEFRTYWHDTVDVKEDRVRVAPRSDYQFEAELDLFHQIGRAEGRGWAASVALDSPAYLAFGPYTSEIGPGTYAAAYRLAVNGAASADAEVAVIDVWDNHAGVSLARRSILRGDFDADNVYQTFGLAFEVTSDDTLLEFRTYWTDIADLNEDGVRIVPLELLQFEAESDLAHQVGQSDGDGWRATVAADNAGYLTFGPYTSALDAGNFTASYRLQISGNPAANSAVATIDIWDVTRNTALAGRTLTRQDFAAEGVYQDFDLDFVLPDSDDLLEFRTQFADSADLKQDRVRVYRALDDLFASLDW